MRDRNISHPEKNIIKGTYTASTTVVPDLKLVNVFRYNTTEDITIANPKNLSDGEYIRIEVSSVEGKSVEFGDKYKLNGVSITSGYHLADPLVIHHGFYDSDDDTINIIPIVDNTKPPLIEDALFWLDGTISGSEFVDKSGNGRNFTITDKDFTASYFPYKSAATISAPVGDATLIAADINNFLYDSGGDPNAIPVVSFFQNIDYEDKLFCRHLDQVLDGNLVETRASGVTDIVLYQAALTGAALTSAVTYYDVPTEVTSTATWVATDGNDTTGDGSKANPWLTVAKGITEATAGDTLYIKSGEYSENQAIAKNLSFQGVGRSIMVNSASYTATIQTCDTLSFKNLWMRNTSNRVFNITGAQDDFTIEKCWVIRESLSQPAIYKPNTVAKNSSSFTVKDCNIFGRVWINDNVDFVGLYLEEDVSTNLIQSFGISNINYCKFGPHGLGAGIGIVKPEENCTINFFNSENSEAFCKLLSITVAPYDLNVSVNRCILHCGDSDYIYRDAQYATGVVNVSFTDNIIDSIDTNNGAEIVFYGGDGTGTMAFTGNVITGVNWGFSVYGNALTQEATISNNTITSTVMSFIGAYDILATITNNKLDGGNAGIGTVNDLASAQPMIIKDNLIVARSATPTQPFITLGSEGDVSTYNKLDGSIVSGNACYSGRYFGVDVGAQHGIFVYDQIVEVSHNLIWGCFLGGVQKSAGNSCPQVWHHNLYIDCSAAWTVKGNPDCIIYNETCIISADITGSAGGLQHLEDTVYPGSFSTGLQFKNNIIADFRPSTTSTLFGTTTDDMVGSDFDNNVYYQADGSNGFCAYNSPNKITFADWLLLGHDTNSIQSNPGFTDVANDDYSLAVGSPAIGAGETLAAAYDDGLDASTDWGDESTLPVVVTKQQTAPWDIGAYVS